MSEGQCLDVLQSISHTEIQRRVNDKQGYLLTLTRLASHTDRDDLVF